MVSKENAWEFDCHIWTQRVSTAYLSNNFPEHKSEKTVGREQFFAYLRFRFEVGMVPRKRTLFGGGQGRRRLEGVKGVDGVDE